MRHVTLYFILLVVLLGTTALALADGFIVIPEHRHVHTPFPLEVVYHRVQVDIEHQMATTSIDQAFHNPTSRQLEGHYIFPVPSGAVIEEFHMQVNGKETHAELLDAKKARKLYEDIVRKARDPALLEYSNQSLYKVRIFPIEPREDKKVSISYREILRRDATTTEYVYPLNTEKFSAKPLKNVSVDVSIRSEESLKNLFSPTHEVDVVRRDEHHARVSYEERDVKPDIDFKLYFDTHPSKVGLSLLSYRKAGGGYFFLSATPALEHDESEINEKDIAFVLDTSGSMAGDKLKQAQRALVYCIENLNDGDRFEIIRFSTEATGLFDKLVAANEANRKEARDYVGELRPVGGTHIEEGLQKALAIRDKQERPYMIVFLTDGKPTIGETDEDKLVAKISEANDHSTRIFTFGIGNDINTHLLDKITDRTRAVRTYISPSEDIEIKVSQFYDKVRSPVLTDVAISYGHIKVDKTHPRRLPDFFQGSNLTVMGRYEDGGASTVLLTGMLKGKKQVYEFDVRFAEKDTKHDFIPVLWASRRVGYLLDLIRLHGEDKELVDEVTQLARDHGIVTPYTSYLIMEDENLRVASRRLRSDVQTLSESITPERASQYEAEYDNLRRKSGAPSVQASAESQALNYARNYAETKQGQVRLNYTDAYGISQNLAQQVRNVRGRAIYQNGRVWVDSRLQNVKAKNTVRVQFASKEYFDLYQNTPEASPFLALGQNVRFHLNDTFYEIYE